MTSEIFKSMFKENIRLIVGAVVVLLIIVVVVTLLLGRKKTAEATLNNHTISVEVAKTEEQKQKGLSGKEKVSDNQGMLFIFDKADYYPFWMKDMKFPIDIIYIQNNKVTTVVENAQPSSGNSELKIFRPEEPSDKVLEINAGLSKKYNIQKGTPVTIKGL